MQTLQPQPLTKGDITEADAQVLNVYFNQTLRAAGYKTQNFSINVEVLAELFLEQSYAETSLILASITRH